MRGELSFFILATEDRDKILRMISKVLGISDEKIKRFSKSQVLTGHYGYPIEHFKIKLDEKEVKEVLRTIIKGLSEVDRSFFLDEIDEYFDSRGRLYIRLDKQRLCLGRINLLDKDPIRLVIYGVRQTKMLEFLQQVIRDE